ncbi:MAG: hypothetical protein M3453_06770 [Pseudomonadota bacterium]|nr:hypothetical protein [Pseudomonadota bacterium]
MRQTWRWFGPVDKVTIADARRSRMAARRCGSSLSMLPAIMRTAYAQEKFVAKIAHTEGVGTPITLAFDEWAKLLNERSRGGAD